MSNEEDYLNSIFSPDEMQSIQSAASSDPSIRAHNDFHRWVDASGEHTMAIAQHVADAMTNDTPIDGSVVNYHVARYNLKKNEAMVQHEIYKGRNEGQSLIPEDHDQTENVKCTLCGKDISPLFIEL